MADAMVAEKPKLYSIRFYSPDQPRDERGRFGEGGGGSGGDDGGQLSTTTSARDQASAVKDYTAGDDQIFRAISTNDTAFLEKKGVSEKDFEKYREKAQAIEDFISGSPRYTGDMYRGISVRDTATFEAMKNLQPGQEISMRGLSSFSEDIGTAASFSGTFKDMYKKTGLFEGGVVFKLTGSRRAASIKRFSKKPEEKEVLLSKSSRTFVKSVSRDGDGLLITLEER